MASTSLAASIYTAKSLAGIERNTRALTDSVYRLVSGNQYVAGQDSTSLAIAVQLQSSVAAYRQGFLNSVEASSLLETASGGLTAIGARLASARATALQAQDATLNDAERAYLQTSLESDLAAIDTIAGTTRFGGTALLDGGLSADDGGEALTFAIGAGSDNTITVDIRDASTTRLFDGTSVSLLTADDAGDAVDAIDAATALLDTEAAKLNGDLSRVDYATENLKTQIGGQGAGIAEISDTDVPEESTRYTAAYLKQRSALALLAQARNLGNGLLGLLSFGNPTTGSNTAIKPPPHAVSSN